MMFDSLNGNTQGQSTTQLQGSRATGKQLTLMFLFLSLPLLLLQSCSSFNGTRLEGFLGADENLIHLAYTIAEDLEKQAFPPLIPRHPEQPILSTTFVNNNKLEETSRFGLVLQEHVNSRFVQMGYTARETKLRKEMIIRPRSGERMLSRVLAEIQPVQTAQAVSVGTYSYSNRTLYISARLIDPITANIISSADYKLTMDATILAMLGLQIESEESIIAIDEPRQSFMTRLLY